MGRPHAMRPLLAVLSCLTFSPPAHAANVDDGIAAFCSKHFAEAFKILQPLAEKGDRDAQLIMGLRFFHGMDGKQDLGLARRWYAKAAEQGDVEAQVYLGQMLVQGQGGETDIPAAVSWFRKAADAGYSSGQYNLGFAYATGQGVSRDTVQAPEWYRKAAEQGDVWAQSNLGNFLINSEGSESKVTGYQWLLLASKNGDDEATKLLERHRSQLAADQLQQAESWAKQFEPKPTAATQAVTKRCRSAAADGASAERTPLQDLIEKDMGPQSFPEPSVEGAGNPDAQIAAAVDAALLVARKHQLHYDGSESAEGRVVVKALWKGDPIALTMRFYRKEESLNIASAMTQSMKNFQKRRGQKVEQLFYSELRQETERRGLAISSEPGAKP